MSVNYQVVGELYDPFAGGPQFLHPRPKNPPVQVPEAPLPTITSSKHRQAERRAAQQQGIGTLCFKAKELVRERVQIIRAWQAAGSPGGEGKKQLRALLHRNAACLRELGYRDMDLTYDPKRILALYGCEKTLKTPRHRTVVAKRGRGQRVLRFTADSAEQAEMKRIREALARGQ